MKKNSLYLLKWYAFAAALGGLLLFGVIAGLRRGDYTPVIAVTIGLAFVCLSLLSARRKKVVLFRNPTPDRAIAQYHNSLKRVPNGKAMAAYLSAFAAVLYGEYDRAREELAAVNWEKCPPMYQGFESYVHSLLAIFQSKDYSKALLLAEEARDLCAVDGRFPGAAKSGVALAANVAVCKLLLGNTDQVILTQVETAARQTSGVSPAIPAWAMAAYHTSAGRPDAAEGYIAIVKRLVPHGAALRDLHIAERG
jgi:hypothetical protein